IGRVGDDGVKHAVLHLAHQAQAVAVQNRPAVAAGVFGHFKLGLRSKYNIGFGCFGQRHLPFCYRSGVLRFLPSRPGGRPGSRTMAAQRSLRPIRRRVGLSTVWPGRIKPRPYTTTLPDKSPMTTLWPATTGAMWVAAFSRTRALPQTSASLRIH